MVLPNLNHEAIDFRGKRASLDSFNGAPSTIVDAAGLEAALLTCANGEGPQTVLEGFTLTGSVGNVFGDWCVGGGMVNEHRTSTVVRCVLRTNVARGFAGEGGWESNHFDSPMVVKCAFEERGARKELYGAP